MELTREKLAKWAEWILEETETEISLSTNAETLESYEAQKVLLSMAMSMLKDGPAMYASQETLDYAKQGELLLRTLSQPSGDCTIPLYICNISAP